VFDGVHFSIPPPLVLDYLPTLPQLINDNFIEMLQHEGMYAFLTYLFIRPLHV